MHVLKQIDTVKQWLNSSRQILVTSHHNPDGDAIGSVLGIYHALKDHYNVKCVVPNDFPDFLKWLPGADEIINYEKDGSKSLFDETDAIFCLDYNALSRTGSIQEELKKSGAKKILIDHHPEPDVESFDVALSETGVSSTAELVYDFLTVLQGQNAINKDVAAGLYVGIMTDTGSFGFNCNKPKTFEITAQLLKTGIDGEHIHRQVYDTYSESRIRLLGHSLGQKLTVIPGLKTAYIALSREELENYKYKTGDTEGIVNYPLSIGEVKVAILLTERNNKIRLSFRSKGTFAVNQIARDHFAGGGHRNAAGGDSYTTMDETIEKLKEVLATYKEEILQSEY